MEAKKCEKKPMTKGENLHKYLRRDVWPLSSYVTVDSFFFSIQHSFRSCCPQATTMEKENNRVLHSTFSARTTVNNWSILEHLATLGMPLT